MASKITDKIWIGDSQDARYPPSEVSAILNCAHDLQPVKGWNDKIHAAHCGLIDGPGNQLSSYYSAVMQLGTLVGFDKTVLVHCHAGQSRSVSVVIMYLNALDDKGWGYWCREVCGKRNDIGRFTT